MAGSRTIKKYTTDGGVDFLIRIDESNAEALNSADEELALTPTADVEFLPQGFTPRYILAFRTDEPNFKRKFKVGNPAAIPELVVAGAKVFAQLVPTSDDTVGTQVEFTVTAYRGEKRAVAPSVINKEDTGLIDGDLS